jgi:hypothetical protein
MITNGTQVVWYKEDTARQFGIVREIKVEACLIELPDRSRQWAQINRLFPHPLHKWLTLHDETNGLPYKVCKTCNAFEEELISEVCEV